MPSPAEHEFLDGLSEESLVAAIRAHREYWLKIARHTNYHLRRAVKDSPASLSDLPVALEPKLKADHGWYSREFKLRIVEEIESGARPIDTSRKYNLTSTLVDNWLRTWRAKGNAAFPGARSLRAAAGL